MGILKFFGDILGITKFGKTQEGQDLQDSANDLTEVLGLGHIFQTEKDKKAAEEKAKAEELEAIKSMKNSSAKTAQLMQELVDAFRSHP